jgi:hypothetical protein
MTTNNLTEQWKKDELEQGWYYLKDNSIFIDYYNGCNFDDTCDCEIKKVLAPVPSYEEWQELNKQRNKFIRDIKDLSYINEENQKLKELLKECRDDVYKYQYISFGSLVKIDEVLK